MSVNSTSTYLRQNAGLLKNKSREFFDGYMQCIHDFEEFGD